MFVICLRHLKLCVLTFDVHDIVVYLQVLFNLANQYTACEMYNEALNTYQVIVKNKMFSNAGNWQLLSNRSYFKW